MLFHGQPVFVADQIDPVGAVGGGLNLSAVLARDIVRSVQALLEASAPVPQPVEPIE